MHSIRLLLASFSLLAVLSLTASPASAQAPCASDITGDGVVDAADLGEVLSAWGRCKGCSADIDASGTVSGEDLSAVLNSWGGTCAPTITGVAPFSGPTAGGTAITITGTHLAGVTAVTIGGIAATSVVAVDATTVTAMTPAGGGGPKAVAVQSPGGTATLANGFTYLLGGMPPTITSVSPPQGPAGTIVLISGSGFTAPVTVQFGGVPSDSVSIVSATSLNAVVPAVPIGGPLDVAVTTADGTATLSPGYFYNAPPSISGVYPAAGPNAGGTIMQIKGTNFDGTTSVSIGGLAALSVQQVDSTTLRMVTPYFGLSGTWDVIVYTSWGSGTAPGAFTSAAAPTISSVQPSSGGPLGGTIVEINGSHLTGATGVTIGGALATNVNVVSDTKIRLMTPAGPLGAQPVVVTTPGGTTQLSNAFTFATVTPAWATTVASTPDPTVVTDPSLRAAIVATQLSWHVRDNATGIDMVLVPPGTFEMGCTASNAHGCVWDESPVHAVTISNPTYFSQYEITQTQWMFVMGANPSHFTSANGFPGPDTRPVENVSWSDVQPFLTHTTMRLPTEAEWEYACRAGTTTAFHGWPAQPSGTNDDTQIGAIAWYGTNAGQQTKPVGQLAPNGFGLYDMAGNVSEWCADLYDGYYYGKSPSTDPQGPPSATANTRVNRGSNITLLSGAGPNYARSSKRDDTFYTSRGWNVGFRVVRTADVPMVSSVTPPYVQSQSSITISGQFLQNAQTVTIGGVAATFQINSDSTIVATAPQLDWGGPYNVVVTSSAGSSVSASGTSVYYTRVPAGATIVSASPDPTVVTNPTLRAAIVASGYPWHIKSTDVFAFDMVLIPPGTFQMGCSAATQASCLGNESPVHQVTITKPYYIGCYEVTQDQWNQVTEYRNFSYFDADEGYSNTGNFPAESMSWNMVSVGLSVTDQTSGGTVWLNSWLQYASWPIPCQGPCYRLPTEAEWEYAYRAGTTTAYHGWPALPNGTDDGYSDLGAIFWINASIPQNVGQLAPNGFGLYDMGGNISEFTSDYFADYTAGAQSDPTGPATGSSYVIRGSAWGGSFANSRASNRGALSPTVFKNYVGLRIARDP